MNNNMKKIAVCFNRNFYSMKPNQNIFHIMFVWYINNETFVHIMMGIWIVKLYKMETGKGFNSHH